MPTHCISASGYTLTITCTPTLDYTLIPDFIPCSIHHLDASIAQPPSALQPHQDCDAMQTQPCWIPQSFQTSAPAPCHLYLYPVCTSKLLAQGDPSQAPEPEPHVSTSPASPLMLAFTLTLNNFHP